MLSFYFAPLLVPSMAKTVVKTNFTITCTLEKAFGYRVELWEDYVSWDDLLANTTDEKKAINAAHEKFEVVYNENDFPTASYEFYLLVKHNCGKGSKYYYWLEPRCPVEKPYCEYYNIQINLD